MALVEEFEGGYFYKISPYTYAYQRASQREATDKTMEWYEAAVCLLCEEILRLENELLDRAKT